MMVAIGKYILLPRVAWNFRLLQGYRSSAVTQSSSAGVVVNFRDHSKDTLALLGGRVFGLWHLRYRLEVLHH
jgi:hypothetical protein